MGINPGSSAATVLRSLYGTNPTLQANKMVTSFNRQYLCPKWYPNNKVQYIIFTHSSGDLVTLSVGIMSRVVLSHAITVVVAELTIVQ